METKSRWKELAPPQRVLTVPMRNGNLAKIYELTTNKASSYRTYEEWKLFSHYGGGEAPFCVLTVPMRNGNIGLYEQSANNLAFLPYL